MTTGLSSRIADLNRPLASYGVDGTTTFSPGMWLGHACSDCECCAADRRVAPIVARMTMRHLPLAAGHVVDLGGLVGHLVHDDAQEVAEHDVDDRPHAGHRGADAEAGEAGFRDRRVDDAVLAELVDQAGQHLERRARLGHVLAHEDDLGIAAHFLGDRFLDRVAERQLANGGCCLRHRCPGPPCSGPDTTRPPRTPPQRPSPVISSS